MIELIKKLIDFVLHIDVHLTAIIAEYGLWTYGILFLIIFAETGLVVTPFLPGDSLLFATGAICAKAEAGLSVHVVAALLWAAAVLGDNMNYWIGRAIGPAVFHREDSIWLRKKHLERAHAFFEKYGGRAIIMARFVPIVRTFVPFVAGVGRMDYRRYLPFDILGGFAWIYLFSYAGYFFGNQPFVKRNFEVVILAIIVISLVPVAIEAFRGWRGARSKGN